MNSGSIGDEAKLVELRARAERASEKAFGDKSLGELLSLLEYELAARHAEAYTCDTIESALREIRKRVGE